MSDASGAGFDRRGEVTWSRLSPGLQVDCIPYAHILLSPTTATMSLSKGTRGLKFMQRAAAIQGKPVEADEPRKLNPGEEDAQWILSHASVAAATGAAAGGSGRSKGKPAVRVSYVQSYLPFINGNNADEDDGAAVAGPSSGARFQFGQPDPELAGKVGTVASEVYPRLTRCSQPVKQEDDNEDDADDAAQESRSPRVKPSKNPPAGMPNVQSSASRKPNAKGFLRPGGFEDAPTPSPGSSTSKGKSKAKRKAPESVADEDVDDLIAGARKRRSDGARGKEGTREQKQRVKQRTEEQAGSDAEQASDAESESQAFLERLMDEFREE